MKRLAVAAAIAAALLVPLSSAAAVRPVPTAVLSADAACALTLVVTWPASSKVDFLYTAWTMDGGFQFFRTAPGTVTGSGTISGRTATFVQPPLASDTTAHAWSVSVQLQSKGVVLQTVSSNSVSVPCRTTLP